jgi:glutamate racemase
MSKDPTSPIGIFDSGVGGLTVARAVMERLPGESIVYFGDTARVPYGVKSADTVSRYAAEITKFLLAREVKLLIVACNTMAALALEAITELSPVPVLEVIGTGAKLAMSRTRNKRLGVIATPATVQSQAYVQAIKGRDPDSFVASKACPLFVPLVEEGWLDHPVTRLVAQEYLAPLLTQNLDTIVLGCTHYPLLKPLLREVVGLDVALLDSAEAVSEAAANVLEDLGLKNPGHAPCHQFHVTDMPMRFREIGERFLGRGLDNVHLVKL